MALLAAQKGWTVKAVARSPEKYAACFAEYKNVHVVKGDALDRASVCSLVQGCDACVFGVQAADGQSSFDVDCDALKMMAEECAKAGCKLIAVSSMLTSPKRKWNIGRMFANSPCLKKNMMDAKWAGEEAVRATPGLKYTIVRPGGLGNEPTGPNKNLTFGQFDAMSFSDMSGYVQKIDVAAVCVEAIANPASDSVSIDVAGPKKGASGPLSLAGAFESMKKDSPAAWA